MLGESTSLDFSATLALFAQANAPAPVPSTAAAPLPVPISPAIILVLCAVAGIGTMLLLPARREATIRKIGGIVLLAAGLIFAAMLIRWTAGTARGGMGFYFWLFSAVAVGGAVRVVTHTKPVYSALYFVLTVFATGGLFLLLWADFMAMALILMYAGAILVTYVFVIMLAAEAANPAEQSGSLAGLAEHDAVSREPVAACATGFALLGVLLFVIFDKFQAGSVAGAGKTPAGTTEALGRFLFANHIVSLELAGLILTIAMVGAIMIARKRVIVVPDDERLIDVKPMPITAPMTPVDDNPHSIPVEGTMNPRQKAYPET